MLSLKNNFNLYNSKIFENLLHLDRILVYFISFFVIWSLVSIIVYAIEDDTITMNVLENDGKIQDNSSNNNSNSTYDDTCIRYDNLTKSIIICNGIATISDINSKINNTNILKEEYPKNWILNANIFVSGNSTLLITDKDTKWLKISSNKQNAYSIKSPGNLIVENTKITS